MINYLWHQFILWQYHEEDMWIACIKLDGVKYEASVIEEPKPGSYWWTLSFDGRQEKVHSWNVHFFDNEGMYGY